MWISPGVQGRDVTPRETRCRLIKIMFFTRIFDFLWKILKTLKNIETGLNSPSLSLKKKNAFNQFWPTIFYFQNFYKNWRPQSWNPYYYPSEEELWEVVKGIYYLLSGYSKYRSNMPPSYFNNITQRHFNKIIFLEIEFLFSMEMKFALRQKRIQNAKIWI